MIKIGKPTVYTENEKAYLIANGTPLVEEYVYQHPALAAFHPESLNTIRFMTFRDPSGNIVIKMAHLRTGCGASCCDNYSAGGIFVPVDILTEPLPTTVLIRPFTDIKNTPIRGRLLKVS